MRGRLGGNIAIDGKTLCNSGDSTITPLHMVSAFATDNSLTLGQLKTAGKGKELEGIQQLLEILDLKGAVITVDAGGCHKVVAEKVRQGKGDYLLCLEGNQGGLHAEVENFFSQAVEATSEESGCAYWKAEERTKGAFEKREVWATDTIDWLPQKSQWQDLLSIACVRRTRVNGKKSSKRHVF